MGNDNGFSKLAGLGQVLLGIGFIFRGIANWKGNGTPSLAALQAGKQKGQQGRVIKDAQLVKVRNIDERVAHIRKAIQEGSLHPAVREEALAILTAKCSDNWCVKQKDFMGEISALFNAMHNPRSPYAVRYTRDHFSVDVFMGAHIIQSLRAGDCDDGSVYLGSMLRAVGYPVQLRVVKGRGSSQEWDHIYNLVGVPPTNPTRWVPLDWSVESATPGWEAPGAAKCVLSGRPSGMIEKVRDFDV